MAGVPFKTAGSPGRYDKKMLFNEMWPSAGQEAAGSEEGNSCGASSVISVA